jgi:hypothetical protein
MWIRTTAIIAVLSVSALTLVSAFPAQRMSMQLQPATLRWDDPAFGVYRIADGKGAPEGRQKLAKRGDRSRVEAAIAEVIRRRAQERERRLSVEIPAS